MVLPEKIIEFCEDVHDLTIHSGHHMFYISQIWFSGYSHGSFSGDLTGAKCRTFYMEENNDLNLHYSTVKVNPSLGCHFFMCPPLQNKTRRTCSIYFGPPSVGTVYLEVMSRETIYKCDQSVFDTNPKTVLTYEIILGLLRTGHLD